MAFEHRELSGSVFKNDRKDQPSHPDYRGDCMIDGTAYWTSGWIKTTKNGDKFLSLAFTKKEMKDQPVKKREEDFLDQPSTPAAARDMSSQDFDDEDLPFS